MSIASSGLVKAHGGPPIAITQKKEGISTGAFIHDTMANSPRPVHMASMDVLVAKTTGMTEIPVMSGVLQDTRQGVPDSHRQDVQPIPKGEQGKTQPKRYGQVPFAGPKY